MKAKTLVELYFEKAPSSLCSMERAEKEIEWLQALGLTVEQIYFSFNYLSKNDLESLEASPESVTLHWSEIKSYYWLAKAKQIREQAKEDVIVYDPKNEYKGANKPSWFRESFDKHLFK